MHEPFDKRHVRKNFHKAAESYAAESEIQRITADRVLRMAEAAARDEPQWILDAGCGTGYCSSALSLAFPRAHVIALDLAVSMAAQAGQDAIMGVCGDLEHLPLVESGLDLIVSNGVLHWCNNLSAVLGSFRKALKPGGTLAISIYVKGTFDEIAQAWQTIGEDPVMRMAHMPELSADDLKQVLNDCGFALPQIESVRMARYFPDASEALGALKRSGLTNARADRHRGLLGKALYRQFLDAFSAQTGAAGIALTYKALMAVARGG